MCIRDRVSGISLEGKDLLKIPSKRRNPILADIFSRLKYMERRGSGFKKILADYEGQVELSLIHISIIQKESESSGEDIAFCVNNCTFYFPNDELSDEQLLELIDFQIKVDYCRQRIEDEIERGIRSCLLYTSRDTYMIPVLIVPQILISTKQKCHRYFLCLLYTSRCV